MPTVSQVKASLALEQKRVTALRGALAETEASDSGHSGSESTSADSSLEQVCWFFLLLCIFVHFCPGGFDLESSSPTIQRSGFSLSWRLTLRRNLKLIVRTFEIKFDLMCPI